MLKEVIIIDIMWYWVDMSLVGLRTNIEEQL